MKFYPFTSPLYQAILKQMEELYSTNTTTSLTQLPDGTIDLGTKWRSKEAEETFRKLEELRHEEHQRMISGMKPIKHFTTSE